MKYNSVLDLRQSIVLEQAQRNFNRNPVECQMDDIMELYLTESSKDSFMIVLKSIVDRFVQKVKEIISTIKIKIIQSSVGKMLRSLNIDAALLEKSGALTGSNGVGNTTTYAVVDIPKVIELHKYNIDTYVRAVSKYFAQMKNAGRRHPIQYARASARIDRQDELHDEIVSLMEDFITKPDELSAPSMAANKIRSGMDAMNAFLEDQKSLTVDEINSELKDFSDEFRMGIVKNYFNIKNESINLLLRAMKMNISTASRIHNEAQRLRQYEADVKTSRR